MFDENGSSWRKEVGAKPLLNKWSEKEMIDKWESLFVVILYMANMAVKGEPSLIVLCRVDSGQTLEDCWR